MRNRKAVAPKPPPRFRPPEVAYASRAGEERKAAYEHSFIIRTTHWLTAIALFVIGGWLGGALQWHFTFMWLFMGAGLVYVCYQLITGTWRQVVFTRRDIPGVWPVFRHYFLFGPKPEQVESYNSLQKLAYTGAILLGALSVITGLILYKSAQLSFLVPLLGGYRSVRILHFLSLAGFAAFVPGHVVMVIVHGWNNFQSMLTGWNFKPHDARSDATTQRTVSEDKHES
jgi:thiosulfate reductase cytochrome b subunit